MFGKPRATGAGRPSQSILVIDLEKNTETTYSSLNEAAIALGIRRTAISLYFSRNQQKPFKGRYIFKRNNSFKKKKWLTVKASGFFAVNTTPPLPPSPFRDGGGGVRSRQLR